MEPPARQAVNRRMPHHDVTAADPAQRSLVLSGYHGGPTPATLLVASFDAGQRLRRAVKGLGGFWGAMVVSVFLPVAHFVLVPSFFGIGIWQFFRRLRQQEQVRGAHGACPDCGAEQDFETGARLSLPMSVQCRQCHRGLTLAEAA
jgi:hypothetical protein